MPRLTTPLERSLAAALGRMLPPDLRDQIDDMLAEGTDPGQLEIVIARMVPSSAGDAFLAEACIAYIDAACVRHGAATIPELELAVRNAPSGPRKEE